MDYLKSVKRPLVIITYTVILFFALYHFYVILGIVKKAFTILEPLILGLCFAFIANALLRPVEKLYDKLGTKKQGAIRRKLKRPICLAISMIIILGVIFTFLFVLIPELLKTFEQISTVLPHYMIAIDKWWGTLSEKVAEFGISLPDMQVNINDISTMVTNFVAEKGGAIFNTTLKITTTFVSFVFDIVLGTIFSLYILAQKEKLGNQIKRILYAILSKEKTDKFLDVLVLSNKTFSNFVTGQLTEALIIGVLCAIGMKIFSFPYALLASSVVGVTALVPIFGAYIGTAVGAFMILMVSPTKALWFIVYIIILQQLENNLIYPRVVGKSIGLPGIWVIAAITVGGGAFGILGMLLGVPFSSVLYCLVKRAVDKRLDKKGLSDVDMRERREPHEIQVPIDIQEQVIEDK